MRPNTRCDQSSEHTETVTASDVTRSQYVTLQSPDPIVRDRRQVRHQVTALLIARDRRQVGHEVTSLLISHGTRQIKMHVCVCKGAFTLRAVLRGTALLQAAQYGAVLRRTVQCRAVLRRAAQYCAAQRTACLCICMQIN